MTITPDQMALRVTDAIRAHSMNTERSIQQAEHRIGASEIGFCRAYLTWMTLGIEYDESDDPKWEAFIGSAIGDRIEMAYMSEHPNAMCQVSFDCVLPSGKIIPCHPDIMDPDVNALVDLKTKNGLTLIRNDGKPSREHEYQVLIYARGAAQNGYLKPGATLYLMYFDRSGTQFVPVTYEVAMDDSIYDEIDAWIDDAMYAVKTGTEPPRDKPWDFCEGYCAFFTHCRGGESKADGLIESEEAALALKVRLDATERKKAAEREIKDANTVLSKFDGKIMGEDGVYELSHTYINPTDIEAYTRRGYERFDVRKQRPPKRAAKKEEEA